MAITAPRDCSKATATGRPPKRWASSAAQTSMASGVLLQFAARRLPSAVCMAPKVFLVGPVQADAGGEGCAACCSSRLDMLFCLDLRFSRAEQAGPCFREGLIVESGNQTASE